MKARYDEATDTLTLILRDAPVAESESLQGRTARTTAKPQTRTQLTTTGRGGLRPGIDLDDSVSLLDAMDGDSDDRRQGPTSPSTAGR